MKIVITSFIQETNSFSDKTCGRDMFAAKGIFYGSRIIEAFSGTRTEIAGFIETLNGENVEIIPAVSAASISSGRVSEDVYQEVLAAIIDTVKKNGPVDGILLSLHGAMMCTHIDDSEGTLMTELREALGNDILIGATLDLHANITRKMIDNADILVGYHTYPHVDLFETGANAAKLLLKALKSGVRPSIAMLKLPMIIMGEGAQTDYGPMREVIELAEMLEKEPEVISASAFQMQPWFDTPEAGCAAVAVSWDACAAQQAVKRLGCFFWDKRDDFRFTLLSVDEAADLARTCKKPVVIGDAADGTGSGSAGDSTYVLLQLMEKHTDISACLTVVDAQAVKDAFVAGIGATREFVIGGKSDPVNYTPARVKGIVRLLSDGDFIYRGPQFTGEWCHMGKTAVIQCGKIDIVVMENSAFNWDPSLYRSQGIEPKYKQLIIVKSPNAFRAPYSHITDQLYVIDSPGISTSNVMRIPFKNIPHPMYPYDDVSDVKPETLVYIGSK